MSTRVMLTRPTVSSTIELQTTVVRLSLTHHSVNSGAAISQSGDEVTDEPRPRRGVLERRGDVHVRVGRQGAQLPRAAGRVGAVAAVQGVTLVHFSAHPEPLLTHNKP
jgi:hypothetical protein